MNNLDKFNRDGFLIIKNGMNKNECKKLIKQTIIPILHSNNIYLTKPHTWNEDGKLLYGKKFWHIIKKNNKHFRFKSLFNSKKLNETLKLIHSLSEHLNGPITRNKKRIWNYNYLAKQGLGWIHLRYPYINYDTPNDNVKYSEDNFHLDGLLNNNNINYKQSVVILPFITTVKKNQGGTAIIPGSHNLINDYILRYNYRTNKDVYTIIDKIINKNKNKIIDMTGEQGDILIMHPHLIHSSSYADIKSKVRITFNLSTQIY